MRAAAVIDVGSNSIKLLVANKEEVLKQTLIFCRLSTGIGKSGHPHFSERPLHNSLGPEECKESRSANAERTNVREALSTERAQQSSAQVELRSGLSDESMEAGVKAIQELLKIAEEFSPEKILIAATSAVREASNKNVFQEKILAATGIPLTIISGEEEANYVAKSAKTDKNLIPLSSFLLFDLGGGSLELILFKNNMPVHLQSFKLGNVRLMERFIPDHQAPIREQDLLAIRNEVETTIAASNFPLPAHIPLVGIGGVIGTSKKLLNIKGSKIKISHLKILQDRLIQLTLEERFQIPNLPHGRADILPIALEVMITLASKLKATELIHSTCNLRLGLMQSLLYPE